MILFYNFLLTNHNYFYKIEIIDLYFIMKKEVNEQLSFLLLSFTIKIIN